MPDDLNTVYSTRRSGYTGAAAWDYDDRDYDQHGYYHRPRYERIYCDPDHSPCYPNGRIVRARLVEEYSSYGCRLDRTWGVTTEYIWAARHCSAQFEVQIERYY